MGKREETEKQILDAAIQIISEKGYNATKTNEVAALANISEAIIFDISFGIGNNLSILHETPSDFIRGVF